MKAVTLWQPYAQAVAAGLKHYETRSWATRYRGPIAIHASIKPLTKQSQDLTIRYAIPELAYGEIIAYADLVDCVLMTEELIACQNQPELDFGDWRPGRYAWQLENIRLPQQKTKISGRQGLWNFDEYQSAV